MQSVSDFTSQAIAELESDPVVLNLRIIIEEQYDTWTTTLFPLLQAKKIKCYKYVTELLHKAGHTNATEELVTNHVRRIREKRKAAVRSAPVTRKAVEARSAPSHAVAPVPVPIAPVAVPAALGVAPIPVTDWLAELLRLEAAPNAEWNGQDQWMWDEMEKVAKMYGKNLARDFVSVERNLDGIQVHCLRVLLNKRL